MGSTVLFVVATLAGPDLPPPRGEISERSYNAIKLEMPMAEVIAILGPPREEISRRSSARVFSYRDPEILELCPRFRTIEAVICYQASLQFDETTTVLHWESDEGGITVHIDSDGLVGRKRFGEVRIRWLD